MAQQLSFSTQTPIDNKRLNYICCNTTWCPHYRESECAKRVPKDSQSVFTLSSSLQK